MVHLDEALVSPEHGIANDFRGSPGGRQVTVVSHEAWNDVCRDLGADLDWTTRRANLLIGGVDLVKSTGRALRIGQLLLEVTGESRPCERMDEAWDGLRAALRLAWRGGVCCRVVQGARVRVGDTVSWAESPPAGGTAP